MTNRYTNLLRLVRETQPKAIAEIGTWDGRRAVQMLNLSPTSKYYGFDLFEDATLETDLEEFNVKAHHFRDEVLDRLTGFDAHLYKGNTRETLKTFNEPVDFVWLDGGHSVQTIKSDWENIKRCLTPGAVVLFDDYFTGPIDITKVGCNETVKGLKHELFPEIDWVKGGGGTQMVRVWP